jgi:UrcA family protein
MPSRALSKFVNSALVAAACALVSGMSQAASLDAQTKSVKVSSAGLDLSSDVGAHAMFKRLAVAAEQACGVEAEFDAMHAGVYRVCYRETLSNAVRTLNHPAVTHVYIAQYPREAARYGIVEGRYVAVR